MKYNTKAIERPGYSCLMFQPISKRVDSRRNLMSLYILLQKKLEDKRIYLDYTFRYHPSFKKNSVETWDRNLKIGTKKSSLSG